MADEVHNRLTDCRQGMRDEFLAAMEPHVASTRDEPGCVFFEYHRHKNDEDVVVLIERLSRCRQTSAGS